MRKPPTPLLHVHQGSNRGILIDKCKSAPSRDVIKTLSVVAACMHKGGLSLCARLSGRHWPVSSARLLVSRKSSALSSASHSVHQQWPNIPMCRDDAVRAAMMPAFSLSLFLSLSPSLSLSLSLARPLSLQQPLALLCSTEHLCLCHYLMRSPSAPSSSAHTVNSPSLSDSLLLCTPPFLSPSPSLFLSFSLSLLTKTC